MKLGIYNYVGAITIHANPHGAATTWVVSANIRHDTCFGFLVLYLFMAALRSRCGHYIFALWFLSSIFFFVIPRLISAVADWMSTILLHMVWP